MHRDPVRTRAGHTGQNIIETGARKVFVAQSFDNAAALRDIRLRESADIEYVDFVLITKGRQLLSKLLISDGILIGILREFSPGQQRGRLRKRHGE